MRIAASFARLVVTAEHISFAKVRNIFRLRGCKTYFVTTRSKATKQSIFKLSPCRLRVTDSDMCEMSMVFEWDEKKNERNKKVHGLSFEVASRVFLDEKRIEKIDFVHSTIDEERINVIGTVGGFLILFVVCVEKQGDTIRIISARQAEKSEEKEYYENYDIR